MKKLLTTALAFLLLFSLCACTVTVYRDNISCEALAENAVKNVKLDSDALYFIDKGEIALKTENYIKDAVKEADSYVAQFTGNESFDEYGIFHCKSEESAKRVKSLLSEYLKSKAADDLYRSYFPDEEYKLDEAEVRSYGNYVVYAVFTKNNRNAFFAEVEQILTET